MGNVPRVSPSFPSFEVKDVPHVAEILGPTAEPLLRRRYGFGVKRSQVGEQHGRPRQAVNVREPELEFFPGLSDCLVKTAVFLRGHGK